MGAAAHCFLHFYLENMCKLNKKKLVDICKHNETNNDVTKLLKYGHDTDKIYLFSDYNEVKKSKATKFNNLKEVFL